MKKVCIFDIDNTITHGENATSKTCCNVGDMCMLDKVRPAWPDKSGSTTYIKESVDNCVANGYELAIATAESGQESVNVTQQTFINSMFPKIYGSKLYQNSCTAQGYKGSCKNPKSHPCCTTEYKDKTKMYLNIADTLGSAFESVNEGKFKYNPDSDEVRDLFVKMFPGKSGYDDLDSNMFIDDENKEAWVLNVDDTPISPKDKAKFVDAVMKLGKKKGWKIKQYGNDAIEIYESVNEASDPLTLPNSSIVSIKGNVITTQAGKKYKILTTKPNLKKKDLYVDMDFMKSSGDPTDGYVAKIDPNDSYGMSTAGLKKVVSVNEASDIRKEYDSLKKASVSFLRSEWSRNQKVGNPKELDKAGLISDLLRWKFGNKKVAAEFGLDESWMLPRFENFVNENENRVYGMFTDDQGKPGKLDKELLDIALKGLPAKITKNIDAVEANGYGGESHISPPTVSNKGQSRGEIEYKMIHIGLLKPMGKNKIMGISLGLRKRTSGPGTGYLYMKVVPDWRHTLGPDAEGAIEFWEDPASFLQKLYNEKFKNWF